MQSNRCKAIDIYPGIKLLDVRPISCFLFVLEATAKQNCQCYREEMYFTVCFSIAIFFCKFHIQCLQLPGYLKPRHCGFTAILASAIF